MSEFKKFNEVNRISDAQLIEALRGGVESPDTRKLLEDWTKQEEDKTGEPEASIEFNRKRARIYIQAGYLEEGLDELEGALDQAFYEHREDLIKAISTEIDRLA